MNKPEDIRDAFEPYFTNATLETETDPYVVVHLANKLGQTGIYTPEQVRDVAELWVTRKGNNPLSAAISPAKNEFARRYAAAIEADDKVTLNALDLFRKDVSTYVRLYDFMSQIIDYGDPYMEMLSIFLRLLEKVIADKTWSAEVDLSDVVLIGVKHSKRTAVNISLTGDGELKGIGAAGTGARKEPKYVALQVVIDKMNDLFGAESFTASQVREFVQGLVQRLLAYPELVNRTKVNSKKQFMESQTSKPRSPRPSSRTRKPTTPWPTTSSATVPPSAPSSWRSRTPSTRPRSISRQRCEQPRPDLGR